MKFLFSVILWICSFLLITENWSNLKPSFNFSRNGGENNEVVNNNDDSTIKSESQYYFSIIKSLKIRHQPKFDAKIVGVINESDKVRYLNEKTDWNEIVEIRGVKNSEPWLKVKDEKNGIVGWIYGGYVKSFQIAESSNRFIQTVKEFLKAEDNRDVDKIFNLFSLRAKSYWEFKQPTDLVKLNNYLEGIWEKTEYSKNTIIAIERNEKTIKVLVRFEYKSNKTKIVDFIDSTVYFDFDNDGKIVKVYGK